MKKQITDILNMHGSKEVKINYEDFKNKVGFEDIFYEDYLQPMLEEIGATHRFSGQHIILKISRANLNKLSKEMND
jgi:hypothetical protein